MLRGRFRRGHWTELMPDPLHHQCETTEPNSGATSVRMDTYMVRNAALTDSKVVYTDWVIRLAGINRSSGIIRLGRRDLIIITPSDPRRAAPRGCLCSVCVRRPPEAAPGVLCPVDWGGTRRVSTELLPSPARSGWPVPTILMVWGGRPTDTPGAGCCCSADRAAGGAVRPGPAVRPPPGRGSGGGQ